MKYFTHQVITEEIPLPSPAEIAQVLSTLVDYKVLWTSLITTGQGQSAEGLYLSGNRLAVEIQLQQKTLYFSQGEDKGIQVLTSDFYRKLYIVVPPSIGGIDTGELLKYDVFRITVHVNEPEVRQISANSFFISLALGIEAHPDFLRLRDWPLSSASS